MKREQSKSKPVNKQEKQDQSFRGRTKLPGQNPRANDAVDHDQNNDENRRP
jgi:hypothetical protein